MRMYASALATSMLVGILIAPVGLVLSALQDRGRPIAWAVGFGVAGLALGALFFEWGLDSDRMAWLAIGVSFFVFWVVLSLRYFHIQERLVFTLASLFLVLHVPAAPERARLNQLAWFGGVALFFITLIFPIQFERQWITVGWALTRRRPVC